MTMYECAALRCECATLRRKCDRLQAKLAKIAAAREPEALALRVLEMGTIGHTTAYRVPSDTAPGGSRTVTYSDRTGWFCDCDSFVYRGGCRHVSAVSEFIRGRVTANQLQTQSKLQEQTQ